MTGRFFVAAKKGGRIAPLLGPFDTYGEAVTEEPRAISLARARDAFAFAYSYGIAEVKDGVAAEAIFDEASQ